jgi:hypothetical protein
MTEYHCKILKNAFEKLVNFPGETIPKILELYYFVLTPIPKDESNTTFRPIAIQEMLLNVMHRLINNRLPKNLCEA